VSEPPRLVPAIWTVERGASLSALALPMHNPAAATNLIGFLKVLMDRRMRHGIRSASWGMVVLATPRLFQADVCPHFRKTRELMEQSNASLQQGYLRKLWATGTSTQIALQII